MKTIYLLSSLAAVLAFGSCKEKGTAIDFGTIPTASDTSYISSKIEAPDKKVVLVEEFTGVSCAPCPKWRQLLDNVSAQHPEQVAVMELHFDFPQCEPIANYSKYDFRVSDATDIASVIYGSLNQIPLAGIDRSPVNNSRSLEPAAWASSIEKRLQETPPANIKIESSYEASSKNATIVISVLYTRSVTKKQFLSVAVLEGGIIDAQKTLTDTEKEYEFKHTFRDMITDIKGDEFLEDLPTKEAGRIYKRTLIYPVDGNWKPEKCKIVAFVHNGDPDDKEILQAAETDLKGQ